MRLFHIQKQIVDTDLSIFDVMVGDGDNWMIDPITNEVIPKPVREFMPIHYRRVNEDE